MQIQVKLSSLSSHEANSLQLCRLSSHSLVAEENDQIIPTVKQVDPLTKTFRYAGGARRCCFGDIRTRFARSLPDFVLVRRQIACFADVVDVQESASTAIGCKRMVVSVIRTQRTTMQHLPTLHNAELSAPTSAVMNWVRHGLQSGDESSSLNEPIGQGIQVELANMYSSPNAHGPV